MTAMEKKEITEEETLLKPRERQVIQGIAMRQPPQSQRAQALLALDGGASQALAAEEAGLTEGQVKYWLQKFRKNRLSIFPEENQQVLPKLPDGPGGVLPDEVPVEVTDTRTLGEITETKTGNVKTTAGLEQPVDRPTDEQKPQKKKRSKKASKKAKDKPVRKAEGKKSKGEVKDKKSKAQKKDKKKRKSKAKKKGKQKKSKKKKGNKRKANKKLKDKKKG